MKLIAFIEEMIRENFSFVFGSILLFIFALGFSWFFRKDFKGLLGRTSKFGKEGLEFSKPSEPHQEKPITDYETIQKLLNVVGESVIINQIEDRIKQDFDAKFKKEGISPDDKIKILTRHLAGTQLFLAFEQIHNSIIDRQINLLKLLNETPPPGIAVALIKSTVEENQQTDPNLLKGLTFDNFLSFLDTQRLTETREGCVTITDLGKEYLIWITRQGRSERGRF